MRFEGSKVKLKKYWLKCTNFLLDRCNFAFFSPSTRITLPFSLSSPFVPFPHTKASKFRFDQLCRLTERENFANVLPSLPDFVVTDSHFADSVVLNLKENKKLLFTLKSFLCESKMNLDTGGSTFDSERFRFLWLIFQKLLKKKKKKQKSYDFICTSGQIFFVESAKTDAKSFIHSLRSLGMEREKLPQLFFFFKFLKRENQQKKYFRKITETSREKRKEKKLWKKD